MTNADLTLSVQQSRRHNLIVLEMDEIAKHNRKYARQCATLMGRNEAWTVSFLGIERKFWSEDYIHYVIEPLYRAGACGSGLYSAWAAKLRTAKGRKDPRVVAFVAAANEPRNV